MDFEAAGVVTLQTMGWDAECQEWQAIAAEMSETGEPTAYQVSLKQKERMLARGERPMAYEEILESLQRIATARHAI